MLKLILKIKPLFSTRFPGLAALLSLCLIAACNTGSDAPDVSGIKAEVKTRRLDKDLYAIDTNNIAAGLRKLEGVYPDFLDFYLDTLLGFGIHGNFTDTTDGIRHGLQSFLTHKDYRGLYDTVMKHYPDTKEIDGELQQGFKYMKHYYPEYKEPKVIYLVSGLNNWGAFTYNDILGIGLDMFLGSSYPFYRSVGIPDYMGRKLDENYIPVAVFRALHQNDYPFVAEDKTLLDMMIQRGKELYFVDKVLPDVPDNTKLAFTTEQLKWCEENEGMVYNFFVKENLFYDRSWQRILRYVNDGPTSAGMPSESPGNIGSWMGWQIVKAYADKHTELSLKQLMDKNMDAQVFLQQSKYKPK